MPLPTVDAFINFLGRYTNNQQFSTGHGVILTENPKGVYTLDDAGQVSISVAGSANVTPTAAQALYGTIILTGALTGNINFVLPLLAGANWSIFNNTTGAYAVTAIGATGTGANLPQGEYATVQSDGTNINAVGYQRGYGIVKLNVAGGAANFTLTADQANAQTIEADGACSGAINIIVPASPAGINYVAFNNTTGAQTITWKTAAGTGIVVAAGKRATVHSDGTNVVRVTADT